MKTSKASFNRFKAEFLRWVDLFGLKDYRVYFALKKLDSIAHISIDEGGKVVNVTLANELTKEDAQESIESHAKHEVLHLLLNRLVWIGSCRYISDSELQDEWERLVIRLEKVI